MIATFTSGGKSHAGGRALNEDAFLERPDLGLWVVADGMGGHRAGDVASQRVVTALDLTEAALSPRAIMARIEAALDTANADLLAEARGLGDDAVVATTVAGLLVADARFACFWAGDSRVYMIRGGAIVQLTRDDSHVQDLMDRGDLTAHDAEQHPLAHVVTKAVGADSELDVHIRHGRWTDGDRFVLCTDGLSRVLNADETCAIASRPRVCDAADALVDQAVARGSSDNVTAIVVGTDESRGHAATAPDDDEPETAPPGGESAAVSGGHGWLG